LVNALEKGQPGNQEATEFVKNECEINTKALFDKITCNKYEVMDTL
jgi:hypothetical protein